jgi:AcrR family transcriptional regulator
MERDKKECILLAAARAFTRFGFKKASVEEIARDAGVAKGTVYLACESKEDLFYQALHREVRFCVAEVSRMIDPRIPAEQILSAVSRAGVDFLESRPLMRDLLAGRYEGLLPTWASRLRELRQLGRGSAIEILQLGIRQGRFREDIDVETVASLLQDIQISTYLFHNEPGPDRAERLQRRLDAGLDMILFGLRPRDSAHPTVSTPASPAKKRSTPNA